MPDIPYARQELFPTSLWSFDLRFLQPSYAAWLAEIEAWRSAEPEPAGRTNRQGWNSAPRLLQLPAFAALEQAARTAFSHAFQEMRLTASLRFQLEGWVNLHLEGGYNLPHIHPNRLLSGCFYLQVPEGSAPLAFRDPRPAVGLTAMPGQGANCGGLVTVQPYAGQLLVFPHWLEHQVEAHQGSLPRVTIGINALVA